MSGAAFVECTAECGLGNHPKPQLLCRVVTKTIDFNNQMTGQRTQATVGQMFVEKGCI